MPKRRSNKRAPTDSEGNDHGVQSPLRIIGGKMRGRKIEYSGDLRTRPMKERVREAIFNLIGPNIKGKHAIDIFAGTGAMGLEAISRGAPTAIFIERHFPTCTIIRNNAASLDVEAQVDVIGANALIWLRRSPTLPEDPWVVFICPPYDMYIEEAEGMLTLVERLLETAPAESAIVLEADERFDFGTLPEADRWDVRTYSPAVVGLLWTR